MVKHIRGVSFHRASEMYLVRWKEVWIGSTASREEAIRWLEKYLETGKVAKPNSKKRKIPVPTREAVLEESAARRKMLKLLKQAKIAESDNPEASQEASHSEPDKLPQQPVKALESSQVSVVQVPKPSKEITPTVEPVQEASEPSKAWKENQRQWFGYLEPLPRHQWPELQEQLKETTKVPQGEILIGALPHRCQFCAKWNNCPNDYKPNGCSDYSDY